ncbi:hypothetical protein [Paenibacillus sp. N3.4]|nr:hypothetical protein [Paenibacillus sp. N3.4]
MGTNKRIRTEREPKLRFAKGCLWSVVISIPVWVLLIWFFFLK